MTTRHGPGVPFGTSFTTDTARPGGELWFRGRKAHPLIAAPFRSAFTALTLSCPDCARPLVCLGERYGCEQCGGMFVEIAALAIMLEEMTHTPWQQPPPSGAAGPRSCPVCQSPMLVDVLEGETVDRCPQDGFWFDPGELAEVLAHSATPEGPFARLRRLLHS